MESSNPSQYNVISSSRQTPPHASPSSSDEPKLLDLLSKQPNHAPPSPLSKRYPKRYARLVDSIDQAFVKSQLIAFSRELGIPANETKAKQKIIARIVASWGWPAPEEHAVEREMKNKVAGAARREVISHGTSGLACCGNKIDMLDRTAGAGEDGPGCPGGNGAYTHSSDYELTRRYPRIDSRRCPPLPIRLRPGRPDDPQKQPENIGTT
jgi:hypothetical protein